MEKLPCDKCGALILPGTKQKTGGICMPCEQKKKREERAEYIRKNRKDVDPYSGVTDSIKILEIMHRKKRFDPLINELKYCKTAVELVASLSEEDFATLEARLLELISTGNEEQALKIAATIRRCSDFKLTGLVKEIVRSDLKCYWDFLFSDADEEVRDKLIAEVGKDPDTNLSRLAWLGDQAVVAKFLEWKVEKPSWAERLYWEPHNYAFVGGWELNENGKRRDLVFQSCFPLQKNTDDRVGLNVVSEADTVCATCGKALVNLFEISKNALPFLTLRKESISILTCEFCVQYCDKLVSRFERGSGWQLDNPDFQPAVEFSGMNLPHKALKVQKQSQRSPFYGCDMVSIGEPLSQIGGHPTWMQDPTYPICSTCNLSMMFIGQIDWGDIDGGDGFFYGFFCTICQESACALYQTT